MPTTYERLIRGDYFLYDNDVYYVQDSQNTVNIACKIGDSYYFQCYHMPSAFPPSTNVLKIGAMGFSFR